MITCLTLGQMYQRKSKYCRATTDYTSPLFAGRLCDLSPRMQTAISHAHTASCPDVGTEDCAKCDLGLLVPNAECVWNCAYQCSEAERATCPCYDTELRETLLEGG